MVPTPAQLDLALLRPLCRGQVRWVRTERMLNPLAVLVAQQWGAGTPLLPRRHRMPARSHCPLNRQDSQSPLLMQGAFRGGVG